MSASSTPDPSTPPSTSTATPTPTPPASASAQHSFFQPSFLRLLEDPSVRTVMMCGCGGGFDFVHSMALYPELKRLGKTVIVGSFSFGNTSEIKEPVYWRHPVLTDCVVKKVTAASACSSFYAPEHHICEYLDLKYPDEAPHFAYAYYARSFTPKALKDLYSKFVTDHSIDGILAVDGGSDSLMVGDESGLGDPIEDAVTVATIASLEQVRMRILCVMGLGCDRFNCVSDAATLRAIAELTLLNGFLGSVMMEPTFPGFIFYRDLLKFMYKRQGFRSVIAGSIVASGEGHFGGNYVPDYLSSRVRPGELYLWPLMAALWTFDPVVVAQRSHICTVIKDCNTIDQMYTEVAKMRRTVRNRSLETLPTTNTGWSLL
ncbi:cell surface glycoprotein [Pelomyxa schiedti]|nr:cell surface glycoprotein [Pelomyxa schiedti]